MKRIGTLILPLLLACTLLLTACGTKEPETPEVIRLTYAVLNEKAANEARVEARKFNLAHRDIQVDVIEYLNKDGRRGRDQLLTEMTAGNIPDIIHLGDDMTYSNGGADTASRLPYQNLARKGCLENLWPYIENDPDLGREGVMEAPLKAAEVDGGLYAVFDKVTLQTVAVPESLAGGRKGWTLEEMLDLFHTLPEDAAMFPYWVDRDYAFYLVFSSSIEGYIDRNAGTCGFSNNRFKEALEFVRGLPSGGPDYLDAAAQEGFANQVRGGLLMQYPAKIANPTYIQWLDIYFGRGGKVAFVGVPTADGSTGSCFHLAGKPLAMSSACRYKEAAWVFLREILLPKYQDVDDMGRYLDSFTYLPINRADYDLVVRASRSEKHAPKSAQIPGLPAVSLRKSTQEEITRFEDLLNRTERIDWYDEDVYNIVYDTLGPYFAGDRTLDDTIALIQNRVGLYLNENK